MKCFICKEEIKKEVPIKLFDVDICDMCLYSIGGITTSNILYSYYKERIKEMQKKKINAHS